MTVQIYPTSASLRQEQKKRTFEGAGAERMAVSCSCSSRKAAQGTRRRLGRPRASCSQGTAGTRTAAGGGDSGDMRVAAGGWGTAGTRARQPGDAVQRQGLGRTNLSPSSPLHGV